MEDPFAAVPPLDLCEDVCISLAHLDTPVVYMHNRAERYGQKLYQNKIKKSVDIVNFHNKSHIIVS